jgi:DNA topoisomerase-3
MIVIVAEKPSVARNIAEVVGARERKDGCIEGNGYSVTWALGHLVEPWDAKDYDEKFSGLWNLDNYPFLPNPFRYRVADVKGDDDYKKAVRHQYNIVKKLINEKGTEEVICATDAGREGELIFRLIYNLADCKKPASRLWVSSMEQSVIREGLRQRRPLSFYDNIYYAALARQHADWDVGINFSVFYTVKYGTKGVFYTAGRVQTVVNHAIVQRCVEIENFVPKPYYIITADLGGFTATHREETFEAAEQCIRDCVFKDAKCTSLKVEKKTVKPDALYNLGDFQKDCNKLFGLSAQESLNKLQELYEKRLVTYPRTDSKYIEQAMEGSVIELIPHIRNVVKTCPDFAPNTKRIVNDAKVTDHHAILPTKEVAAFASLEDISNKILSLVCWRLLIATGPDSVYESTKAVFDIAGYEFAADGKKILESGFRSMKTELYKMLGKTNEEKENILPTLAEGQFYKVNDLNNEKKMTTPPPYFTDATVIGWMETCGKEIDDEELKGVLKGVGIGTSATRAETLEKLIRVGYIVREKGKLMATAKGKAFDDIADEKIKTPETTAEWEQELAAIASGEESPERFMSEIEDFVYEFFDEHRNDEGSKPVQAQTEANVVGKCPKCGKDVVERKICWSCSAGQGVCDFVIWKHMGSKTAPKAITETQVKKLLSKGKTDLIKGFTGQSGRKFDAYLVLKPDLSVGFEFPPRK